MANVLDTLAGTLPLIIVGGLAMKMTDSMFDRADRTYERRQARRSSHRPLRRPAYRRGSTGVGFGNFSNLGI